MFDEFLKKKQTMTSPQIPPELSLLESMVPSGNLSRSELGNCHLEIVDLPSKDDVFPLRYLNLPEGNFVFLAIVAFPPAVDDLILFW